MVAYANFSVILRLKLGILCSMTGWIALDIDGTITEDKYSIPAPVIDFLKNTTDHGWKIAFATGRAFVFAAEAVRNLNFPFVLFPQNGSIALDMPAKEVIFRHYMSCEQIPVVEEALKDLGLDCIVYSGYENRDRCYFRPSRLSPEDLAYVREVEQREKESWIEVDEFPASEKIPLIKCFGKHSCMLKIGNRLQKSGAFHLSLIRDPFHRSNYVLLITDKNASKGNALREIVSLRGNRGLIVAAGDDENDLSLLQAADIKIAMPHAPESLRKIADFIAPPTSEMGILQALKIVIDNASNRRA